jgi:type IX secretion system PorP/SprF family membrane protein
MKKNILLLVIWVAALEAGAQQLQPSSLYDMQGIIYNPSNAGTKGTIAGVSYRSQWSGISGGPKTITAFGAIDIKSKHIGLGGYLYKDKTGPTQRTGIAFSFAKHIPMANGNRFSLGIEAKGQQYTIDRDKLNATLGADPALGDHDNRMMFDAGFGISYTADKLQLGASVSQLVQSKMDFYNGSGSRTEEGRLYRHYYFNGSYKFSADQNTTITPSGLITYLPNAPTEYQIDARVEHNEKFWWGLGYRVKQSFILNAGFHVNQKFTFGYAFDIYNTPLSIYEAGSNAHELLIRYKLSQ